jgi:hypothetical protein
MNVLEFPLIDVTKRMSFFHGPQQALKAYRDFHLYFRHRLLNPLKINGNCMYHILLKFCNSTFFLKSVFMIFL